MFQGTIANVVGTMASANPILVAEIATVAALTAGIGYLVYQWYELRKAVKAAEGEMLIAGTLQPGSAQQFIKNTEQLKSSFDIWKSGAVTVEKAMAGLSGPAAQYSQKIAEIAVAEAKLTGGNVTNYAKEVYNSFSRGASGALSWAEHINLLDANTKEYVQSLIKAGQQTQAIGIIVEAANGRFVNQAKSIAQANKQMRDAIALSAPTGPMGIGPAGVSLDPSINLPSQKSLTPQAGPPINQQAQDDMAAVQALDKVLQERQVVTLQLAAAQRDLAEAQKTGNSPEVIAAQQAIAAGEQRLLSLHTTTEQQTHQATLARLQSDLAAAKDHANARIGILKQIEAEQASYNGQNSATTRASITAVTAAEREAADQSLRIQLLKIEGEQVAARDNVGQQIALENQKIALLAAAGKQDSTQYQQELNRKTGLERQASDQAISIAVTNLRAKQDADGQDFKSKLAIEDQILAMLRQHYGAQSTAYAAEVQRRASLQNQAAQAQIEMELRSITSEISSGDRRLAALRSNLKAELDSYQITFNQEQQILRSSIEQEGALELSRLNTLIDSLTKGTQAWQRAMDERKALTDKMNRDISTLNEQRARRDKQIADRENQDYQTAFSSIGRAWSSLIGDMLSGTSTWYQMESRFAKSLLTDFANIAMHMLGTWIATEIAKTASTTTQNAVREAQDIKGQTGLVQLLMRSLGIYTATETSKTAASTTGTAVRTAVSNTAQATDNSWFLVRAARWLASELGMTTATTAQTAVRSATQATSEITAHATTSATNVMDALSYAAVGAAAAGASVAAIPVTGWAMVPAVTAETYGTLSGVASMASLDVGAWQVPKDMIAQIHQDEMVVPADFASGLRNNMSGGSSGGMGGPQLNFSPTMNLNGGANGLSRNMIATLMSQTANQMYGMFYNSFRNGATSLPGSNAR
jgi:hypothetical protein